MPFDYLKKKRILITGNTGFKGSWLTCILKMMGAEVYGYSNGYPTTPSLYKMLHLDNEIEMKMDDISDYDSLFGFFTDIKPQIVIHMAAQPIVREGYKSPMKTYETNVIGTVNVMECLRNTDCVESFLNVTTDKVYENLETDKYYQENDRLDGFDPYSNSKSCSELVTHCYKRSFFQDSNCQISTARAGNVIGGGDYATDRIVPDCVRAALSNTQIIVRNPNSIRPYQHVLEPLYAYLTIICKQHENKSLSGSYNVGPEKTDCITTGELVSMFCDYWGENVQWKSLSDNGPHEANYLKLDNGLIKEKMGVSPLWTVTRAIKETVDWTKKWQSGDDVRNITETQIMKYFAERGIDSLSYTR